MIKFTTTPRCLIFDLLLTSYGPPLTEGMLDELRAYGAAEVNSVWRKGGNLVYRITFAIEGSELLSGDHADGMNALSDIGSLSIGPIKIFRGHLNRAPLGKPSKRFEKLQSSSCECHCPRGPVEFEPEEGDPG